MVESDPFALDKIRVSQSFHENVGVRQRLLSCDVRKPNRNEFVRVRTPVDAWSITVGTVDDPLTRDSYLVDQPLHAEVPDLIKMPVLTLAISRLSQVPFLWAVNIPANTSRWYETAVGCLKLAEGEWVRVSSDLSAGAYVPYVATGNLPDPKWPEGDGVELKDFLKLAFQSRFVTSIDHPLLQQLRGER